MANSFCSSRYFHCQSDTLIISLLTIQSIEKPPLTLSLLFPKWCGAETPISKHSALKIITCTHENIKLSHPTSKHNVCRHFEERYGFQRQEAKFCFVFLCVTWKTQSRTRSISIQPFLRAWSMHDLLLVSSFLRFFFLR